ncbi:MAG: phosphoribosylglycinamide formyltransferase [Polyangiaceae bacterium]|nr:phosphoribosylglycinamide formyltransferase [Polyangiaceae bacterium]
MEPLKLGVLVSGNGTNLQAILDAIENDGLSAQVCVVISNKAQAFGLERARRAGVPAVAISHLEYGSREEFDGALVRELKRHGVEWVVLAGFMRIVTEVLLNAYPDRVVNIHPALLPSFPGVSAQGQAIAYGVKLTGCTVHFVESGVDSGPIIAQRALEVLPEDDERSLTERLLKVEHGLLVDVLQRLALNKVQLEDRLAERRRVRVDWA